MEQVLEAVEMIYNSNSDGLLHSEHCSTRDKDVFADDHALLALLYLAYGEERKAEQIIENLIVSPLYDRETGLFFSRLDDPCLLHLQKQPS